MTDPLALAKTVYARIEDLSGYEPVVEIEMAYDDFDPPTQGTPVRAEAIACDTVEEAEALRADLYDYVATEYPDLVPYFRFYLRPKASSLDPADYALTLVDDMACHYRP